MNGKVRASAGFCHFRPEEHQNTRTPMRQRAEERLFSRHNYDDQEKKDSKSIEPRFKGTWLVKFVDPRLKCQRLVQVEMGVRQRVDHVVEPLRPSLFWILEARFILD